MKKTWCTALAVSLVIGMMTAGWAKGKPDAAGSGRANAGGQVRGQERAKEVQQMNTTADEHRGFVVGHGLSKVPRKHKRIHAPGSRPPG